MLLLQINYRLLTNQVQKMSNAKKQTKIGPDQGSKVMFFPRTQRTLLRTSKGSHFQAHKWVFLTFKICFLYPNKSH